MELKYRLYTPEDVPVISKLWQSSTEWGALSPALVSRHLENAPFGKPIFSVAENVETGEIVGQAVLMPSLISVKGNPVTAFRPMAAIVDHTLRVRSLNPLQHPIFCLLGHGFDEMCRRGEKLVFVLPDPKWRRVIQLMPDVQHAAFPLWSLPLPLSSPFSLGANYCVSELTNWDQRVDMLFAKAAGQFACMVMRNADALLKKSGPPEYEVLGVERSGELVGVVASKQKGDRQWLICDLMAADPEAQTATLKAVCNLAHLRSTEASAAAPIHKAAVLAAPPLLPVLQELGFRRDKYDFHLFVKLFDNSMSPADVHPSLWYVSAND
jgi:hypothetical protein